MLEQLDARRARAFAETDPQLLERVYLPDSPALEQDRRQVAKCVDQQCSLRGVRFAVHGLDILQVGDRRCVLRVRDRLQPYEVVYEDGRRLHRPGGALTTRVFTLERDSGGRWRISSIHGAGNG